MWQREEIIRELQSRGKRMTGQRKILLDVILEGKWTCCKEIYFEASRRDPSIGLATVYRMVGALEEIGVLRKSCCYSFPPDEKGCESGWQPQLYV